MGGTIPVDQIYLKSVLSVAADILGVPDLTAASSPETVDAWDSLAHLNLTLALEQQFGVQFTAEEGESVGCIADWVALVITKCRGGVTK